MATSGSNTTWSSNGGHYIKVTWNETSQSTTENRSAVTVKLYFGSKSGWTVSDSTNSYSLTINGTTYSGSNTSLSHTGGEELIMSQSLMIYHNSDGTKTFSMKGAISGLYFGGITGSTFSGTLDMIPQASTFAYSSTSDLQAGTNKTVTISRKNSNFYHQVRIYLTKSGISDYLLRTENYDASTTSKTITWSSSEIAAFWANGHGYYTGTKFVLDTYYGGGVIATNTQTGSLDYPSNNSVASMQGSINVGESFDINIARASPLYSHEAELRLANGTKVATRSITSSTSFSMTPNSSTIYANTTSSNSIAVELWIRTVLTASTGTQVFSWTKEDTGTVYVSSGGGGTGGDPGGGGSETGVPPVMGTMYYTELETTVASAIGSSGTNPPLVQNKSRPRFTFTAATGQNSASIVNYTVSIGGVSMSKSTAGSLDFPTLNVSASTSATLTATDSRGMVNSITIPVNFMAYRNPVITANTKRTNGFGNSVELTGSASISSLGGANSMSTSSGFRYRYRLLPSGGFTGWSNASSTLVNGIPTMNKVTLGLSNDYSYEFEIMAVDILGSSTILKVAGAGRPIAFIDNKLLSVGINRFPVESSTFEVEEKMTMYPSTGTSAKIGDTFTGNTNKAYINFKAASGSNDPGFIMHETSVSVSDTNKGVLHLCPSDDADNSGDYVSIHGTNDPENIKLYTGGNGSFTGTVSAFNLSASNQLSAGFISTSIINTNSSYLGIQGANAEMVRMSYASGSYGYLSWYNGASRLGYVGSVASGSTTFRVVSDSGWLELLGSSGLTAYVGGNTKLQVTGSSTVSYNDIQIYGGLNTTGNINVGGNLNAGSNFVQGSLIHNSGYMHINVFNTTSSHYSSAASSTQRGEMYFSGTSNNRVIFVARTNDGATVSTSVQAGSFPTSSSIKYKEAIEEYREDALQKIMQTGIKTYRFKGHDVGARKVGVIIEHGVPDEIVETTRDAIDSYSMVSMSWKAIQQLGHELFVKDQEIEVLHDKQEAMEKEVEDLREMVKLLMERVDTKEGGR